MEMGFPFLFHTMKTFFIALIAGLFCFSAVAADTPHPAPRVLFSPWAESEVEIAPNIPVLRHMESILNFMGYRIEYFSMDTETMPDPRTPEFRAKFAGVITYFHNEAYAHSRELFEFLKQASSTDLPWMALGKFGFLEAIPEREVKELFTLYGVQYLGTRNPPLVFKTLVELKNLVNYERKLQLVQMTPILATEKKKGTIKHWLKTSDQFGNFIASPVFTSKKFSLAYGNYGLWSNETATRRQWQIDPFAFFEEALEIDRSAPVPDVAALNGRRVFFAHIDGDAFVSLSKIDPERYCGEIMVHDVVEHYDKLPFGVSFVIAEVMKEGHGNMRIHDFARKTIARSNVEAASHTYYHPLMWRSGTLSYFTDKVQYDDKRETLDSLEYIKKHFAGGKPVEALYWSGNCYPGYPAHKLLADAGYMNINGGDSRWDSTFPSIAYVAPVGRHLKDLFQVYSANANDNTYTNGWTGPYFGYSQVIETFEKTGSPRLLKPINTYFHFFSAERQEGVDAVRKAIDWAMKRPIAPIFPTTYIRSAMGWKNAELTRLDDKTFELKNAGELKTLRIDRDRGLVPDLAASKGVMGYTHLLGALYVHLAPDTHGEARLVLQASPPNPPYLDSVGGLVLEHTRTSDRLKLKLAPFSRGPLVVKNLKKPTTVLVADGEVIKLSTNKGTLEWKFDPSEKARSIEIAF